MGYKFKLSITLVLAIVLVFALPVSSQGMAMDILIRGASLENRYLVQIPNSSSFKSLKSSSEIKHLFGDFYQMKGSIDQVKTALTKTRYQGRVEVFPDRRFQRLATPNDTLYSKQWNLRSSISYGIELIGAHNLFIGTQPGQGSVVAVIDTGYTDHPDLSSSFAGGFDFIDDLNNSNDQNGRDTDPRDPGDWNARFASSWHGTHVHGIISATKNNRMGIVGVAPAAKVIHARVLGTLGGLESDIASAIRWSAGLNVSGVPDNPNPADVINLSLGRFGECGTLLQTAIDDALNAGSVVVVAAGNDNSLANLYAPANCRNTITVAATGPTGLRAEYSNYGSVVELAAPGGDFNLPGGNGAGIWSTANAGGKEPIAANYRSYAGTSMAAPHVAGIAALVKSINPTLSAQQIIEIINTSTSAFKRDYDVKSCSWYDTCGRGITNAFRATYKAMNTVGENDVTNDYETDVQRSPQNVVTAITASESTIQWDAPVTVDGLSGYSLTVLGQGVKCENTSTQQQCVIRDLKTGNTYEIQLFARYGIFKGPTISISFTIYLSPSPAKLKSVKVGKRVLTPTWDPARANSPFAISHYLIEGVRRDGTVAAQCETPSTSCSLTGLRSNERLKIRITAWNEIGSATSISSTYYKSR